MKLNLGCGKVYKPGYINIDRFDKSVADKSYDVSDLPFEPNSASLIEASQLIEHFDYIHCKYILSEWFRVLKPGGTLLLETPDMEKGFKKFISSAPATQETTLQWLYGIDSPGMGHKTGFTYSLLKNILETTGFTSISREKQQTHFYEPGMRVVCRKPKDYAEKQLFACFRKRLLKELNTDDSYILIPLEKHLKNIADPKDIKAIMKTALCNPRIPLIFLDECVKAGMMKKSDVNDDIALLEYLAKIEIHKKLFSLWLKSKKEAGRFEQESKQFLANLEALLSGDLSDYKERLRYIADLKPIHLPVFDFTFVLAEAQKMFNRGVKQFHNKDLAKAQVNFLKSSRMNPDNPLVYWNMARLGSAETYETALSLLKDKVLRKKIKAEMKSSKIPKEPIPEGYI